MRRRTRRRLRLPQGRGKADNENFRKSTMITNPYLLRRSLQGRGAASPPCLFLFASFFFWASKRKMKKRKLQTKRNFYITTKLQTKKNFLISLKSSILLLIGFVEAVAFAVYDDNGGEILNGEFCEGLGAKFGVCDNLIFFYGFGD